MKKCNLESNLLQQDLSFKLKVLFQEQISEMQFLELGVNLSHFYSRTAVHRNFSEIGVREKLCEIHRKTSGMESFLVKKDFDELCVVCS